VNPIKIRAYIFHGLMDDDATKKKVGLVTYIMLVLAVMV
jgi:hypothetical protein